MLETLSVENVGIIDRAEVEFAPGMVVISGETGAGKTLLITALALLLGDRPRHEVVGPQSQFARVQAVFSHGGEEVIVGREVLASGRTRCRVDGVIVPVGRLSEVVKAQLQLYGQHLALAMGTKANQCDALDKFGGLSAQRYLEVRRTLRETQAELRALRQSGHDLVAQQELARYELNELESAKLEDPHEDETLLAELRHLEGARERALSFNAMHEVIGGDGGVLDLLRNLESHDEEFSQRLRAVVADLEEIASDAARERDSIEDDPERRVEVEARLGELAHIKRRFGPTLGDAMRAREQRVSELSATKPVAALEEELVARCDTLEELVRKEHDVLLGARRAVAAPLQEQITEALHSLSLERARFDVAFDDTEPFFLFSSHDAMEPLELGAVASGGELARVMLAVAAVVGADAPSVVFDEVDAGIGGSAALSVAHKLASISNERQVLVVTHLPQIAAAADQHLVVQKNATSQGVVTTINEVSGRERESEIARMLSGHPNSSRALEHARELLASFGGTESVD